MPSWVLWLFVGLVCTALLLGTSMALFFVYCRSRFVPAIARIFQEKPLFIIPRGEPSDDAQQVHFPTSDGLTLRGCYFKARAERRGVILFGLEFGSDRWAAQSYCDRLRDAGYDVFTFEPRNQGESEKQRDYQPLQWVTDRDLHDTQAAIDYLTSRPDADPRGVGLFGVSKGGSVGLLAAANDDRIACAATDGAFGTMTTVLPYMRRWVEIYSPHERLRTILPNSFYRAIAKSAIHSVAQERNVQFLNVESAVKRLNRPLLMIHGGGDTYIKPEMARSLCNKARKGTAELWIVAKAKHNQALLVAGEEYHRKLIEFFDEHLAGIQPPESSPDLGPVGPVSEETINS